jgi:hypothetical protein
VFDLSYFYAIAADFHTPVRYLFSKPKLFGFDELAPRSVQSREYDGVSRDPRNSQSESQHQNL